MSENEIETYINRASPHLFRSTHGQRKLGPDNRHFGSSYLRTSKQVWVKEDQIPTEYLQMAMEDEVIIPQASKVSWRIQNATLMNVFTLTGGEAYQVANYGIAGQYSQHYDAAPGFHFNFMILFYLQDLFRHDVLLHGRRSCIHHTAKDSALHAR